MLLHKSIIDKLLMLFMSLLFTGAAYPRRLAAGLLTLWLSLIVAPAASAAMSTDAEGESALATATPNNEAGTIVGVFFDDKPEKSLRKVVIDRLSRLGEDVKPGEDATELTKCKQAVCYAEIAARSSAARVLRMDVYESASRRYYLEGVIYSNANGAVRTSNGSCDDCSSENLRAMLSDLAARLVAPEPTARPPESTAQTPKLDPGERMPKLDPGERIAPPPPAPLVDKPRRWTPGRMALITLLSAVTGAMLIGTIALGTMHPAGGGSDPGFCLRDEKQSESEGMGQKCLSQPRQIAIGSILTGVSAAGLALNLYLILHQPTPRYTEVVQARSTSHE